MKIYLPHINYTVEVRKYKPEPSLPNAFVWCERIDKNKTVLYLRPKTPAPSIAHELVHVLRYICRDRHMDFTLEEEHMAYIMQYLLGKLTGMEWQTSC
jgi:hypothetical protein